MSELDPGALFDATCSWSGYNHQGMLAILFAIKQVLNIFDTNPNHETFMNELNDYFIELEYVEDFSIGKSVNGSDEYYYVHQVKNHSTSTQSTPSEYESALLGLMLHILNRPTIKKAYLHTTVEISFKSGTFQDYVEKLKNNPSYLTKRLTRINCAQKDIKLKKSIIDGNNDFFKKSLLEALKRHDDTQTKLDYTNIDVALSAFEGEINDLIAKFKSMTKTQLDRIELYSYKFPTQTQSYCKVDQIIGLIIEEIRNSVDKLLPDKQLWKGARYLNNRFGYLLRKLNEHIIERNLFYKRYDSKAPDKPERKIRLSVIYEWLTSDEIETADEYYFQYKLKENFLIYADDFCLSCLSKNCDDCLLKQAVNKISLMTGEEMNEFLSLTCPSNTKPLSMETIPACLSRSKIRDPFFHGIRDISIPYEKEKLAITYIPKDSLRYLLTTLALDFEDDIASICTDIAKNSNLFSLCSDYNCLISKDIACDSILCEDRKITNCRGIDKAADLKANEHITQFNDLSIKRLDDFLNEV